MNNIREFQKKIYKQFKKYKLSSKKKSFKEICFPKEYTFQKPQLFVGEYINPKTSFKNLLIYHKIGAGKTCAAIRITLNFLKKKNIIIVCPASLINNFYKELRSECTEEIFCNDKERKLLNTLNVNSKEYKLLLQNINSKIDNLYNIYSYNKFIELINNKKIKYENTLLIIDEIQNLISEYGEYYKIILNSIENAPLNLITVLISATPIFDKPVELALLINLFRPKNKLETGKNFLKKYIEYDIKEKQFKLKNEDILKLKLNKFISYYEGAPEYVFPQKILKVVKCHMSNYQYKCYKIVQEHEGNISRDEILNLPNNFFIGSRIISNIAYPNKLINKHGFEALINKYMQLDTLKIYSSKFYFLFKKILKSSGPIFIYSSFKEYGGIATIIKILEYYKYKNFYKHGAGINRFAVWSGSESLEKKDILRIIYNSLDNQNGKKIKIILGTPAIKEGISLLRIKQVHILEPYWNMSRIEQIIGRAVRYCSHKDLPINKRFVKIYLYLAIPPKKVKKDDNSTISIDEYIYNIALKKKYLNDQFENLLKDVAIDYYLFQ